MRVIEKMVAQGRGVKPERLCEWIDGALYTPEQAKQQGMVDCIQHRQDFESELRKKFGEDIKLTTSTARRNWVRTSIPPRLCADAVLGHLA